MAGSAATPRLRTRDLGTVLEDAEAKAIVLRQVGQHQVAAMLEEVIRESRRAAEEYLTWMDESAALVRSGHEVPWFRRRFPLWEQAGHAVRRGRLRYYRQIIVPVRLELTSDA